MPEILIYDVIGSDLFGEGITPANIKDQLDSMRSLDSITVRINSPGGDVFDGFAIHNLLKQHDAEIRVVIDGVAASAASLIAVAGDTVEMAENSLMMIHNPYTFAIGDETEMLRTAEMLAKVKSSIITSYVSKSGMAEDDLAAAMDIETWYTAKDAVAAGLADKIIEKEAVINRVKAPWIRNAPNIEKTQERRQADYRLSARKRLRDIG